MPLPNDIVNKLVVEYDKWHNIQENRAMDIDKLNEQIKVKQAEYQLCSLVMDSLSVLMGGRDKLDELRKEQHQGK